MGKNGLLMSREQVEAHQRRHFGIDARGLVVDSPKLADKPLLPRSRMNGTETEYSLILEAMKRRGDILEWRFEGISLAWGVDPATGKPMYYTPDFWVVRARIFPSNPCLRAVQLIETKGAHIFEKDLIRFKGCRAEWPMFAFEMHQKKGGEWNRIQ